VEVSSSESGYGVMEMLTRKEAAGGHRFSVRDWTAYESAD
jgi:hypothetical protein